MNTDSPIYKYPEHLNPFRKRRNSLTQSFRGIKDTVLNTIRKRDKSNSGNRETVSNTTDVKSVKVEQISPPLPRSRFSERIGRSNSISDTSKSHNFPRRAEVGDNSFDNKTEKTTDFAPIHYVGKTYKSKKVKHKAPQPPNKDMVQSPNMSCSETSLVSVDSLSSCDFGGKSISELPMDNSKTLEILEITNEIKKFAEDTTNENKFTEEYTPLWEENNQKSSNSDKNVIEVSNNISCKNEYNSDNKKNNAEESNILCKKNNENFSDVEKKTSEEISKILCDKNTDIKNYNNGDQKLDINISTGNSLPIVTQRTTENNDYNIKVEVETQKNTSTFNFSTHRSTCNKPETTEETSQGVYVKEKLNYFENKCSGVNDLSETRRLSKVRQNVYSKEVLLGSRKTE